MRAKDVKEISDQVTDYTWCTDFKTVMFHIKRRAEEGFYCYDIPQEIVSPRLIELLLLRKFDISVPYWITYGVRVSW